MTPLDFAVDALATHRLTRAITRDSVPLTARPRDAIRKRWPDSAVAYLVGCDWCVSVWVGTGVAVARRVAPRAWAVAGPALASSTVAALIASRE